MTRNSREIAPGASTEACFSVEDVREALRSRPAAIAAGGAGRRCSVALLLRQRGEDAEILFILRATCDGDPWSGNIAFPGGGLSGGETAQEAAERETLEEIGISLREATLLGRLDDIYGATLPVLVSCFVYCLQEDMEFSLNGEVARTFWVPLSLLADPSRHVRAEFSFGDRTRSMPAIVVLREGEPLLWGLTYRFIVQLLDALSARREALAQLPESLP